MTSPCGKIRIPINEEGNDTPGQIQEYLDKYHGEGVQHIALGSTNLYDTVDAMQMAGVNLLNTSETYYELLPKRIPGHGEDLAALQARNILVDGKPSALFSGPGRAQALQSISPGQYDRVEVMTNPPAGVTAEVIRGMAPCRASTVIMPRAA